MVDRPPTKGLAVLGGAPPTAGRLATGTATSGRLTTGARTSTKGQTARTAGGSFLDPVAQELILKLRLKFGDVAANVSGQEIITREVLRYLETAPSRPAKTKEADMSLLEERIRTKLLGGTASRNTLAAAKRAAGSNEWLSMFELESALGHEAERRAAEAEAAKRSALKQQLDAQLEEHERLRQQERRAEEEYWRQEQAALRKAEEDEAARRQLQHDIMLRLKSERKQQMADREARRDAALSRRRAEEALQAARTAYDTAEELRREEAERVAAKLALRDFLAGNEANKALKEEEKRRRWAEDAEFKRRWEEQLNRLEDERRQQMERIKRAQAVLQDAADRQGEMRRRWLETPLVERYSKEREDARAAEEERRLAAQKEGAARMTVAVAEQLREREAARQRAKQEDAAYAASVAAKVRAAEEAERARKAALAESKLKMRADIEAQMRDAAARRREAAAPMTDLERRLNSRTLAAVAAWQQGQGQRQGQGGSGSGKLLPDLLRGGSAPATGGAGGSISSSVAAAAATVGSLSVGTPGTAVAH